MLQLLCTEIFKMRFKMKKKHCILLCSVLSIKITQIVIHRHYLLSVRLLWQLVRSRSCTMSC